MLINNGGRSQRALVEATDLQIDQDLIALNVVGTLSLTKAVLPHMLRAKRGTSCKHLSFINALLLCCQSCVTCLLNYLSSIP